MSTHKKRPHKPDESDEDDDRAESKTTKITKATVAKRPKTSVSAAVSSSSSSSDSDESMPESQKQTEKKQKESMYERNMTESRASEMLNDLSIALTGIPQEQVTLTGLAKRNKGVVFEYDGPLVGSALRSIRPLQRFPELWRSFLERHLSTIPFFSDKSAKEREDWIARFPVAGELRLDEFTWASKMKIRIVSMGDGGNDLYKLPESVLESWARTYEDGWIPLLVMRDAFVAHFEIDHTLFFSQGAYTMRRTGVDIPADFKGQIIEITHTQNDQKTFGDADEDMGEDQVEPLVKIRSSTKQALSSNVKKSVYLVRSDWIVSIRPSPTRSPLASIPDLSIMVAEVLRPWRDPYPKLKLHMNDISAEYERIAELLQNASASVLKSLLQKIIRLQPQYVDFESFIGGPSGGDDPTPAPLALCLVLMLLMRHPGSFNPEAGERETGFRGAVKRLAICTAEDSYADDQGAMFTQLVTVALLQRRIPTWYPSEELIKGWFTHALAILHERRCFNTWKKTGKVPLPEKLSSTHLWSSGALLLHEVKSLAGDYVMLNEMAKIAEEKKPMYSKPAGGMSERPRLMPAIRALDQHCATSVVYFMDHRVIRETLLRQEAKSNLAVLGPVMNRIFMEGTGLNPRKCNDLDAKLSSDFMKELETAQARYARYFYGPRASTTVEDSDVKMDDGKRPQSASASASAMQGTIPHISYTLPDAMLAGAVSTMKILIRREGQDHPLWVTVRTDNIYEYVVMEMAASARSTKLKNDEANFTVTEEEKKEAIEMAQTMLRKYGVPWKGMKPPIESWQSCKIFLHTDDGRYWLRFRDGKEQSWDAARNLSIPTPYFPLKQHSIWDIPLSTHGVAENAWNWLKNKWFQPVQDQYPEVLRRLREIAGGYRRVIPMPSIGRDGGGTDSVVSRYDPHVFQLLLALTHVFPEALALKRMPYVGHLAFETKNAPLFWSILERVQKWSQRIYTTTEIVLLPDSVGTTGSTKAVSAGISYYHEEHRLTVDFRPPSSSSSNSRFYYEINIFGLGEDLKNRRDILQKNPHVDVDRLFDDFKLDLKMTEMDDENKTKTMVWKGQWTPTSSVPVPIKSRWPILKEPLGDFKLFPHQLAAVRDLESRAKAGWKGSGILMSTGSGKTLISIHNMRFHLDKIDYIIHTCPNSCMTNVARDWERCGFKVHFLIGNKTVTEKHQDPRLLPIGSFPRPFTVTIIDHEQLRKVETFLGESLLERSGIVFDEMHRTLRDTLRTASALKYAQSCRVMSCMTATPIIDENLMILAPWMQMCVPFEITKDNVWVALLSMVHHDVDAKPWEEVTKIVPLIESEAKEFKSLMPLALGGTQRNGCNARQIVAGIELVRRRCTVGSAEECKRILDTEPSEPGIHIVTQNSAEREAVYVELVRLRVPPKLILRCGSSNRKKAGGVQLSGGEGPMVTKVNLDSENSKTDFPDIKVVITSISDCLEGYNLCRFRTQISRVFACNPATRTQYRGRINRVIQRANTVRSIVVLDDMGFFAMRQRKQKIPDDLNKIVREALRK